MKTQRAIKKCAWWLSYCLSIGWKKDQLEKIWWMYHDDKGNLTI